MGVFCSTCEVSAQESGHFSGVSEQLLPTVIQRYAILEMSLQILQVYSQIDISPFFPNLEQNAYTFDGIKCYVTDFGEKRFVTIAGSTDWFKHWEDSELIKHRTLNIEVKKMYADSAGIVVKYLAKKGIFSENKEINFVGYSIAAPCATYAALIAIKRGWKIKSCVVFGSPRCIKISGIKAMQDILNCDQEGIIGGATMMEDPTTTITEDKVKFFSVRNSVDFMTTIPSDGKWTTFGTQICVGKELPINMGNSHPKSEFRLYGLQKSNPIHRPLSYISSICSKAPDSDLKNHVEERLSGLKEIVESRSLYAI